MQKHRFDELIFKVNTDRKLATGSEEVEFNYCKSNEPCESFATNLDVKRDCETFCQQLLVTAGLDQRRRAKVN